MMENGKWGIVVSILTVLLTALVPVQHAILTDFVIIIGVNGMIQIPVVVKMRTSVKRIVMFIMDV